ncbi:replication initiation protein [uncultured Neisseria sp.]|jgi:plasmid replication initiation protein|uniref:replication initiation protein n=1 Tax=uncultured Neisseria sp. TaxID=237778 RepID=UPI0025DFFA19|nr:replication initiation protein [uncultured Neisseria sp.]
MGDIVKKSKEYDLSNRNVVISNYITRSAQTLNLVEKRILMAGIAKLGGVNGEIKLTAQEYADTYDVDMSTAYRELKNAVNSLMKRYLSWQVNDGKHIGTLTCVWVQGYKYFKEEGYVKFKFSEYVFPFLFELEREFTKYQLQQAAALRSIYSWRLLEMFEQMKDKTDGSGWLSMSIEEFWHAVEATESYRANFQLLRKRVIEPAIKELTEKDGWLIEWEVRKRGRKVSNLLFKFERNPQGGLFNQETAPIPRNNKTQNALE